MAVKENRRGKTPPVAKREHLRHAAVSGFPGDGGEALKVILGGGVPPGPENPYPISDKKLRFFIPYFRHDSPNVYPISDPGMCDNFGNSTGLRDAPNDVRVFLSSRSMSTATHVTLKMVS